MSTLISLLTGLRRRDPGTVELFGHNPLDSVVLGAPNRREQGRPFNRRRQEPLTTAGGPVASPARLDRRYGVLSWEA